MIGFDIGGTKCAVCIGAEKDGDFIVTDKKAIPTDHSVSPYEMIDRMCAMAEEMTDDFSVIGISCGGPLDSRKGIIQSPPNLPGWDDVPIVSLLREKYGIPAKLQNDANACALAEYEFGAGKGTKNMIFLTFGTGLGAGLVLDGRLYEGTNGMAGEAGHLRLAAHGPVGFGKAGSFEGFCSGGGIAQLGRIRATERFQCGKTVAYCADVTELEQITAQKIAECAYNGDELSREIYRESGHYLGKGLALLIDLFNPERIVIGSIYGRCRDLLEPYALEVIEREALTAAWNVCEIVPAGLGEKIGDYAALAVAKRYAEERGSIC